MKIFAGISLFLALTLGAYAETYVDKENGFTLNAPDAWVKKDPDLKKMPYVALKLQTMGPVANERGLFYVDIFDQDSQSTTEDIYVRNMKDHITGPMQGEILSEEKVTVSGLPGVKVVYRGISHKFTGNDNRFMRVVVHANNGKFYVLHGVTGKAHFERHQADFDQLVAGFQLSK